MKKILGKIAFVFIVVMLANTITSCELGVAVVAAPFILVDALIETPKEKAQREKWEQEKREWNEKFIQYKDVDTF